MTAASEQARVVAPLVLVFAMLLPSTESEPDSCASPLSESSSVVAADAPVVAGREAGDCTAVVETADAGLDAGEATEEAAEDAALEGAEVAGVAAVVVADDGAEVTAEEPEGAAEEGALDTAEDV
ncbi:hypothetical protein GGI02_005914, partial [Coemansia sp. RSA 2322]